MGYKGTVRNIPGYYSWAEMVRRCTSTQCKDFNLYGARGITVCDEWRWSFPAFLRDMGPRPDNASLDRKDGDKGYYKENCRWATPTEQANNTKRVVFITYRGETKSVSQWAKDMGLSVNALWGRLNRGLSFEDAISLPLEGC